MFLTELKKHKKLCLAGAVLVIIVLAFALYVGDCYRADDIAVSALSSSEDVEVYTLEDGSIVFSPEDADSALVFYPGGKVEHTAYGPLMMACAQEGLMCLLLEMPFNLAVLDMDAAEDVRHDYPQVEHWYIGGHSLGGSMAASHAAKNPEDYCGLIMLAAYSTADITESGLGVLSIYGSEDCVLNGEKYEDNLSNLPAGFTELVIAGGNHAQFGSYGEQKGDGKAGITATAQIELTAAAIGEFICAN